MGSLGIKTINLMLSLSSLPLMHSLCHVYPSQTVDSRSVLCVNAKLK